MITRREAETKALDLFDLMRPEDVTDSEWLTAKVIFGFVASKNEMADSYILSISQGFTDEQIIEAMKSEAKEYKPKIKKWIINEMR